MTALPPPEGREARGATVALIIAAAGGVAAVVVSIVGASDRWFGLGIAVALVGLGFGAVAWSKSLEGPEVVETRVSLSNTAAVRHELDAETELTEETMGRRPVLVGLLGTAVVTLGAAIVSPVLSLGPRISGARDRTSWSPGVRLVTPDGTPVAAAREVYDQLMTVFPEGHTTADDSQVALIRVRPDQLNQATMDGGGLDGWVAYSKICTHLGCSVGLLGIDTRPPQEIRQLVCPCHQSIFDPLDQARPTGGPATMPLPQLQLGVDDDGFLVALSDFDRPVGPASWHQAS